MEKIDYKLLQTYLNDKKYKDVKGQNDSSIMGQFLYHNNNLLKMVKGFDVYQLSLWIKSRETYIKRKNKYKTHKIKARSIVMAELGDNIGNELSYNHPCIVIMEDNRNVFVVPCSSSLVKRAYKNGKLYKEYFKGTTKDGFEKDTILILNNAKWISKSRIHFNYDNKGELKPFNRVTESFFSKLYDSVFKYIFSRRDYEFKKIERENNYFNEYY